MHRTYRPRLQQDCPQGFTLVELLLTVAILSILATIAIPRVNWAAMGKAQSETAAQTLLGHLRLTKSLAIMNAHTNSVGYKLVFTPGMTSYSIVNSDTTTTIKGPFTLPENVLASGDTSFEFTPLGELSGGSSLSVQLAKSGHSSTITVSPVGRIRLVL